MEDDFLRNPVSGTVTAPAPPLGIEFTDGRRQGFLLVLTHSQINF